MVLIINFIKSLRDVWFQEINIYLISLKYFLETICYQLIIIQIIFKQIYLTHRKNADMYYHFKSEWSREK